MNILNYFDNQNVRSAFQKNLTTKFSPSFSVLKSFSLQHLPIDSKSSVCMKAKQARQQKQGLLPTQPWSPSEMNYIVTESVPLFYNKQKFRNAGLSDTAKETVPKIAASNKAKTFYRTLMKKAKEYEIQPKNLKYIPGLYERKEKIRADAEEIKKESASSFEKSLSTDYFNTEIEYSNDRKRTKSETIDDMPKERAVIFSTDTDKKQDVTVDKQETKSSAMEELNQDQRTVAGEQKQEYGVDADHGNHIQTAEAKDETPVNDDRSTKEGLSEENFDQQLEMPLAPVISTDRDVIDSAKPVELTSDAGQPLDGDEVLMLNTDSDSFSGSKNSEAADNSKNRTSYVEEPVDSASTSENSSSLASDQQPSLVQPPFQSTEELIDSIPSTAFVPLDKKSDNEATVDNEPQESSAMPSFCEWKEMETEKNRQLGAEPGTSAKSKTNKKRSNYASVTCGAKIVGANPEAQNPSFMLIENKDQYMINPCKARKVFTIELCEPVQVQAVEIGNLELFSSLPQNFDVNVSDRFPSKDWKSLGRFHARDERTVQTFHVADGFIFAKYIRIEMLSHYGAEHYCPLSILRVFGITVDEDDDGESENLDVLDEEEEVMDILTQDNPTNLFATATDTVLSLVKTVLNPSADVVTNEEGAIAASSVGTESSVSFPGEENTTVEPCLPDVMYVTKLWISGSSLKEIISECAFCDIGRNDICFLECRTVCEYYRVVLCVEAQSCLSAWCYIHNEQTNTHLKPEANVPESRLIEQADLSSSSVTETVREYIGKNAGFSASETAFESVERLTADKEIMEDAVKATVMLSEAVSIDGNGKASGETKPECGDSQQASLEHSVIGVPSLASKEHHSDDRRQPCHEFLSQEEVIQSQNENLGLLHDQAETGEAHIVEGQVNPANAVHGTSSQEQSNANLQYRTSEQTFSKTSRDKDESSMKEIFADISSKANHGNDYELDNISLDEMTFHKLSPRGKESAFIKLKNRIKLLEVNLNLTNRYLEELSQRYKRQMEEMHSSLNKTINQLSNMTKQADERDLKQQNHIVSLETTIENLTSAVSSMEHSIKSVNQQMIERHLYLIFLEVMIFGVVIVFCLNRKTIKSMKSNTEYQSVGSTEPFAVYEVPHSDGSAIFHRKLTDSKLSKDDFCVSGDVVEEAKNCLVSSGTMHPAATTDITNDFLKKRKKTILKHNHSVILSVDKPSHSPATGLMFDSCKDSVCSKSLPNLGGKDLQFHFRRFSLDSSAHKPWKWSLFGSKQNNKPSLTNSRLSSRPETGEYNIRNGLTDHTKHCLVNSYGIDYHTEKKI